jgi:hypothetical protein
MAVNKVTRESRIVFPDKGLSWALTRPILEAMHVLSNRQHLILSSIMTL